MSLFLIQTSAYGYDITDKFSIGGIIDGFILGIRAAVGF
jgi:hypothetical protein